MLPNVPQFAVRHMVGTAMGDQLGGSYGAWITFAVRHLAKMVPGYALPLSGGRSATTWADALKDGAVRTPEPHGTTLDHPAFLQYTGGTTGLSKGAETTQRNIVAATLQAEAWFGPALARTGVVECAAVGVACEKQGAAIQLFVVRRAASLSEDDVLRFCHEHLTGYKRPRQVEFREALPKTSVGKILRRELRAKV